MIRLSKSSNAKMPPTSAPPPATCQDNTRGNKPKRSLGSARGDGRTSWLTLRMVQVMPQVAAESLLLRRCSAGGQRAGGGVLHRYAVSVLASAARDQISASVDASSCTAAQHDGQPSRGTLRSPLRPWAHLCDAVRSLHLRRAEQRDGLRLQRLRGLAEPAHAA